MTADGEGGGGGGEVQRDFLKRQLSCPPEENQGDHVGELGRHTHMHTHKTLNLISFLNSVFETGTCLGSPEPKSTDLAFLLEVTLSFGAVGLQEVASSGW